MVEKLTLAELLKQPKTIEDVQIPQNIILDIVLRLLYSEGNVSFQRINKVIRVPNVLDILLEWMKSEHLVETLPGQPELGRWGYVYTLSKEGELRARAALERSLYIGPAPVPIHYYNRAIELQTQEKLEVDFSDVEKSLSDLILPPDFHRRIGPALNSGSSMFIYGPSGNGKTTIAHAMADLIAQATSIWLPYALTAGGQIIQVVDRRTHKAAPRDTSPLREVDGRWGLFHRPSVAVGGELKMEALDLRFDEVSRIFEAPLQLKANGGMLLIDDFGRQQTSPSNLLNRWIVPLEEGIDYLRLHTGQIIVVPFRQLIVFSTNLDPYKLADDAFYRRIQMKVHVDSPTAERYEKIFQMMCKEIGITFDPWSYEYLLKNWYQKQNRQLQAVQPRDLLNIIRALCEYEGITPRMTPELIDEACHSYFVGSEKLI